MAPPAVLMVGTGEYTTGFVSGAASTSDKKVGVVGLTRESHHYRGIALPRRLQRQMSNTNVV